MKKVKGYYGSIQYNVSENKCRNCNLKQHQACRIFIHKGEPRFWKRCQCDCRGKGKKLDDF